MSGLQIERSKDVSASFGDSPSIDAFARVRTSEPHTVFDSKQLHDNAPLFWDDSEVSGGSTTSTHSVDTASTVIAVANTTAGKRVRQTFMRFNYQPGKSQLMFLTGTLDETGGGAGITRAMGLFDDENGIFMQDDEGTVKAVIRSYTGGSASDTKVAQSAWNLDTLGAAALNPSGITLDATASQILVIDFEWLAVGRVRIGFVFDGIPVYVHQFVHANSTAGAYMSTPNLPLRYEIENDGTGAASNLEHICSTVISEGGSQHTGALYYKSTEGSEITCAADGTLYALLGIKLKSTHLDASVEIERIAMQIQTASENAEWCWIWNPTVTGTFTYANITNSAVMIAIAGGTPPTSANGTASTGGFLESTSGGGGSGGVTTPISNARRLGAKIDGTVDELVLCYRPVGGTSGHEVEAGLTWRELT
jgi:hypothetical protein